MNFPWLDIAFSLADPFSYKNFILRAAEAGVIHALQEQDYLSRVGVIKGKMSELNTKDHQAAYQKAYHLGELASLVVAEKSCCGGGKVL